MTTQANHPEAGFTIQETIVVILVGSLLVGFSYALYLFVMGFVRGELRCHEHRQTVSHVASVITADIEQSRTCRPTDSSLVLETSSHGSVVYALQNGILVRNGMAVAAEDSAQWRLSAHTAGDTVSNASLRFAFEVGARWENDSCLVNTAAMLPWSSQAAFVHGKDTTKD